MYSQHKKDIFLTNAAVNIRRLRAKELYTDDAMQTQKDVGTENLMKMTWDAPYNNIISNDVMVKCGWPSHILMCQIVDTDRYGTAFPPILVY